MSTYDPIIAEASRRFGVPEQYIRAVIQAESSGRPGAVSSAGAGGLMQIMPPTYSELARKHGLGVDRFDPANNITAGTAYMRQLNDLYGGDWHKTMFGYNAGPGVVAAVDAGKRDYKPESKAYVDTVLAGFGQTKEADVPQLFGGFGGMPSPPTGNGPVFSGQRAATEDEAQRWMNSAFNSPSDNRLEFGQDKNFYQGLGGLLNMGQEPSQSPRTDPAALPGTTQTDRLDLSSRINELMNQLSTPGGRPQMPSQLQYMLAGAQKGVQGLAGVHDRKVGIGEMLGAMGGGVTSGYFAGNEAKQQQRAADFTELGGLTKMDEYQRKRAGDDRALQATYAFSDKLAGMGHPDLAAAVRGNPSLMDEILKAMAAGRFGKDATSNFTLGPGQKRHDANGNVIAEVPANPPAPQAPKTVTTADGVFVLNPDGSRGARLGASETAPDTEAGALTLPPEERLARGLPEPGPSPYDNPKLSPRGRSNLVIANTKQWEKRQGENAEAVQKAQAQISDMDRFIFLNEKVNKEGVDTAGWNGGPITSTVRGWWNPEIKEMSAIRDRITPTLRQPGSGATSDFDARMFQGGTVGPDKPLEVNRAIATATTVAAKNLIAKAQFEQAYFDAYQHTGGMEAAWQKYLNDNPIFDPDPKKAGSYALNPSWTDWQTYFRNGGKVPEKVPQASVSGGGGGSSVPPPPPGAVIGGM